MCPFFNPPNGFSALIPRRSEFVAKVSRASMTAGSIEYVHLLRRDTSLIL
jgi:hypothetical protein